MTLNEAISIAAYLHRGQLDKQGQPYILHPLRVMLSLNTEQERILAALHDVVEDAGWPSFVEAAETVKAEVEPWLRNALSVLTRRPAERYADYIDRVSKEPLARIVKLADIHDNMLPERMLPNAEGVSLHKRYAIAQQKLLAAASADYAFRASKP